MTAIYRFFFLLCSLTLCSLTIGAAHAQQDLKDNAVQRVVHAHDASIFVATGALYLKQTAIRAADGKPLSPALESEVDHIIDTNVRDPAWFYAAWSSAIEPLLSVQEADEIAAHFTTEGGQLQRQVIEQALGEVLMSTYTFTNRIDYHLAGSSREMQDLQRSVGPARGTCACPTQKDLQDLQRVTDSRQFNGQDLSIYPGAVAFATGGTGVKYVKILMMQGVGSINTHFESVAKQIQQVVAAQKMYR
jgi:hypothetical protein